MLIALNEGRGVNPREGAKFENESNGQCSCRHLTSVQIEWQVMWALQLGRAQNAATDGAATSTIQLLCLPDCHSWHLL